MLKDNIFDFIGGESGPWKIVRMTTVTGEGLEQAPFLNILPGNMQKLDKGKWALKAFRSNIRYTERTEEEKLAALQEGLGRPQATHAALIPIRKSDSWWKLAQDERRALFEPPYTTSGHNTIGIAYLPAIARRLYHCRDIGEPFDFLTWFEYAPADSASFEELVDRLRKTKEWEYVDREIDIRLIRA